MRKILMMFVVTMMATMNVFAQSEEVTPYFTITKDEPVISSYVSSQWYTCYGRNSWYRDRTR